MTDEFVAEELSKFFDLIGPVGIVLVALLFLTIVIILSKLVTYGQNICKPISPFCSRCKIERYCERIGVVKSR